MKEVYTVGERCPLGCLAVILVKRVTDDRVFAWCGTCGLAWAEPKKETWQPGDYGSAELHASAIAKGSVIAVATWNDIERSKLTNLPISAGQAEEWCFRKVDDYNMKFGCDKKLPPVQRFWRNALSFFG